MDNSNDHKDVPSLFTNDTIALFMDADLFKGYSTCYKKTSAEVKNIHVTVYVFYRDQN